MTGRRVDGLPHEYQPGDYGPYKGGWWVCLPNGDLCNVSTWTVIEHEDRTITVSPSINSVGRWHGWLKAGVFSTAAEQ